MDLTPLVTSPLLEIQNLTVRYKSNDPILNKVCFRLRAGEICRLTGDSGCGKTTLGYAITGLLPPDAQVLEGSVLFQGRDLLRLSQGEMRRIRGRMIAMMPQDPEQALNPALRVGTQVEEVIRSHERTNHAARRCRALRLFEQVELNEHGMFSAYPQQLSGGQRQRVVLAQALAAAPVLLLADEPTSALDESTAARMLSLLSNLSIAANLAMLLITHDASCLNEMGIRTLELSSGSIVESASPALGN